MIPLRRLLAVASGLLLLAACAGQPDGPERLRALLEHVPAETVDRGLYYTDVEQGSGFGTVLPLRSLDGSLLGGQEVAAILETGGAPLTVFAGDITRSEVARAAEQAGYGVEREGQWIMLERPAAIPDDAPAWVTATPAGAVRRGVLVLGAASEVHAVVAGAPPGAEVGWVDRVVDALSPEVAAVALGSRAVAERTERWRGEDPARLASLPPLGLFEGFALTWIPDLVRDEQQDSEPAENGSVIIAYPPDEDGGEGPQRAEALALRAATAPVFGPTRQIAADLLRGGAPRWHADEAVVRLPVRWEGFDGEALRRRVDDGRLMLLLPDRV